MTQPPEYIIRAAVEAGGWSPCAKSKRGAVVFIPVLNAIEGVGHNAQPSPFACTADERCRAACAKLCLHAEQVAIQDAIASMARLMNTRSLSGLHLLHAKVVNRLLVPGGGPSCWQCSRLVLATKLEGVWLYEAPEGSSEPGHYRCTRCHARMRRFVDMGEFQHQDVVRMRTCGGLVERVGEWRFYTAEAFHRATLKACGIEAP